MLNLAFRLNHSIKFCLKNIGVSREGIKVDPMKIEVVMKWEPPKTPTEIRSFLGLADYYMRFIQDFSKVAVPLTRLTKKEVKFVWDEKQQ